MTNRDNQQGQGFSLKNIVIYSNHVFYKCFKYLLEIEIKSFNSGCREIYHKCRSLRPLLNNAYEQK
jgi:hypothetical protein